MGEFASKGAAYGIGIPALVAGGLALLNQNNGCGNGVLGNILGGNNNCHVTKDELAYALANDRALAEKDSQIAELKAGTSVDTKLLELYRYNETQFKERDTVITATLIEEGKQQERINCLRKDVDRLQDITAAQNVELADSRVRETELNGRVNTLAVSTKDRFEAFANEFNTALGCEISNRKAADEAIYGWTDCNFVRNVKKVDASQICPLPVTSQDVLNYYLNGNTSATPAATGGTCCASGSTRASSLDKK